MNSRKHRILIVDDHPIVRQGIRQLIVAEERFEVCGEAASWGEAIEEASKNTPDAVVLDISLGKRMGLNLIQELLSLLPKLRVLVLSMHDEMIYAERALKAGAHAYVMKGEASQKVLDALDQILASGMYVSKRLSSLLLEQAMHPTANLSRAGMGALTNRELELLKLIGEGLSSEAIATRLNLSLKTVEAHRGHIRGKLGLETGDRLLEIAIRYTRDLG